MKQTKKDSRETLFFIPWAVSVIAMLGSLYFSEVRGYEPCELCWYQRILMYPLVLILGIAVVQKNYYISLYGMVFSSIGALLSLYHYLIQKVSALSDTAPACGRIPCTGMYINYFGFVTIPFLALVAFIIIFITSFIVYKRTKEAI